MKFTKEQAFETIKGRLTPNGKKLFMSERSINEQLETLIPIVANEEMELSDFVEKVIRSFETMNLNVNKDQSDFVKQWKESHPSNEPTQAKLNSESTETNADLQALLKRVKMLEEENASNRQAKTIADKRNALIEEIKKKGVKDDQWIADYVSEIAVSEDMDVASRADSALRIFNRSMSNTQTSKTPASTSTGKDKYNDRLAGVKSIMKAERQEQEQINNN